MPFSQQAIVELLGRHAALGASRRMHEVIWQEISDFLLPHASGITTVQTPGTKRTTRLFDSTAIDAVTRLASNFQGGMTNQATIWMSHEFEEPALQEDYEAGVWIDDVNRRQLTTYGQSNAYQAFHELYLQLIAFGTGIMYVEEHLLNQPGFDGFTFCVLPLGSVDLAEGENGQVDTVMAVKRLSARQAVQRFGEAKLSDTVKQRLKDGGEHMDKVTSYLHVVQPRAEKHSTYKGSLRLATAMPWASCYVDMEDKKLVAESGYEEFPYFVPRWSKTVDMPGWMRSSTPDSPWGFGPGHVALPDVKTLNAIKEWTLKALPLHLFPPGITDDDSVIGRFDMTPGAMNAVRHGSTVTPYQIGGNPQLVELSIEELKQSIRSIFYYDQLAAIPNTPQKTAFEVAQVIEQMQRVMGPTFSRLTTELFDPLANRTFGIRLRAGGFLPPPQSVLEEAAEQRGRIRVKYEGPLARAQRSTEIEAIQRLYTFVGDLAERTQNPAVWDTVDDDKTIRHLAEVLGVPKALLRNARLVAQMQQQRQEAAQQQADMQQQLDASQAAKNVTPLLQQGVAPYAA